ncbi:MAG TPA: thiamine pyrophosphate-binding protein [Thermoanaerobaculia bacterium]|nr:thiamine pyrophosphate-binding protein [Thermoanaerobaculia bacterium]
MTSGGALVAEVLVRHGVRFLFTLCGGHISPILAAAKGRGIRVIDTRHEATAVFAADAVARLTGVPGVAAVTAGPGVTNAVTALQNARLAQSPLVLLGGATATVLRGRGALQDIDQLAFVRPIVKWATAVTKVRDLVPALERAFSVCREGVPGPVFVECPVDLLYDEALVRSWYGGKSGEPKGLVEAATKWYLGRHLDSIFAGGGDIPSPDPQPPPLPEPEAGSVGTTALLLARSERPVVVLGSGGMMSPADAQSLARAVAALDLPVYLSGTARGLLGAASPLQVRHRRKEALREADLVLLAGVPCDFRLDYGRQIGRSATLVSVNRDRSALTLNRRPTLGAHGDPALFLRALAADTPAGFPHASWLGRLRERDAVRDAEIAASPEGEKGSLDPVTLCRRIEEALPPRSVVVADGGDFVATASYVLRPRGPLSWLDPGVFGTLGVGAGFALGAALCRPDEDVLLLWGDGSAGYGLVEIDTFVRHGLGVVAVIGNDAGWTQIAREQVEVLKDDVGTVLRATDYHEASRGLGGEGLLLDDPGRTPAVLADAFRRARTGRPVVVNALLGKTAFRKGSISL